MWAEVELLQKNITSWQFKSIFKLQNVIIASEKGKESHMTKQVLIMVMWATCFQNTNANKHCVLLVQWDLYSGDTLGTEANVFWIEVSPE